MVDEVINENWQPLVLEVGAYESVALLLKALESPLSSPVAWFGVVVAVIRVAVLIFKSIDEYHIRKMKKELMQEEIESLKHIREGKRIFDLTDEELKKEKQILLKKAKDND